jgi:hypothetical protein
MDWMKRGLGALFLVLLGACPGYAGGTAVVVDPEATIRTGGEQRPLLVGADILLGDLIQTSSGGHVELAFDDGTKIVVGPGSALLIEDYLLRADGSAGDFAISALGGTFRFVSGKSAKDRYRITTPTGTIGIRGTAFDLVSDESTKVLMYSGETELCAISGECAVIANVCELGEMTRSGASSLGSTTKFNREERKLLRSRFVYGASQQPLQDAYRLQAAGRCLLSPLPFTPQFFETLLVSGSVAVHQQVPKSDLPGDLTAGPPGSIPDKSHSGPPTDSGGDCAGNSDHNPGHSQNCTGK